VRYVIPHSELSSEDDSRSDSDTSNASSHTSSSGSSSEDEHAERLIRKKRKSRSKRQVHAAAARDVKDEKDDGPGTPVQGRKKRRREWKWTLGSLDEANVPADSETEGEVEVEVEKGRDIVVDELARVDRPATPEIPLPPVTEAEDKELDESYVDSIEEAPATIVDASEVSVSPKITPTPSEPKPPLEEPASSSEHISDQPPTD
jgi:hypothetical protein